MDDVNTAVVARALTAAVATIWPLATPVRLTPLTAGHNRLVYRIEASATGPPRILHVYRHHANVARVRYELALFAALRDALLPFAVPTPLATRAGEFVHHLQVDAGVLSGALAVLWTEVVGTHPDPADEGQAEAAGVSPICWSRWPYGLSTSSAQAPSGAYWRRWAGATPPTCPCCRQRCKRCRCCSACARLGDCYARSRGTERAERARRMCWHVQSTRSVANAGCTGTSPSWLPCR